MSHSTLALLTVPLVTAVIGYVTNWTGVLMLFYPVHFKGWRVPGLPALVRLLPHKLQQIPGLMIGGIGWQGIVPSRAAKMGSLAVDSGIAKIGRPEEIFRQLEPDRIAEQITVSTRDDLPSTVDAIMEREQPGLWTELPPQVRDLVTRRVQQQLPDVVHELTAEIGEHIDQLVDVKLMVIKRFDPELANRVFLDMGDRELRFIKNFGAQLMPPPRDDGEDGADAELCEREALRRRGARLLRTSAQLDGGDPAHPAYAHILTELAPDEGRILRMLGTEGARASVDVRTANLIGAGSELVAGGMNMIGAEAGCRHRDRVPAYLNNLERLGLIWFSREPVQDLIAYQVLEAQPEVIEAMRRVSRARTVQRSIHLTPFGRDFCVVCLPLAEAEAEALSDPPG